MYKIRALALTLILGGGYLGSETTVPSDHNQLRSWFDGSYVSQRASGLAQAANQTALPLSTIPMESAWALSSKPNTKPPRVEKKSIDQDTCEEDFLECAKRNWRWLVLTTLGGTTAFLLHKFITVSVEGGPVLAYGLLFAGFLMALGLIFLVSYYLSRKKKKSD